MPTQWGNNDCCYYRTGRSNSLPPPPPPPPFTAGVSVHKLQTTMINNPIYESGPIYETIPQQKCSVSATNPLVPSSQMNEGSIDRKSACESADMTPYACSGVPRAPVTPDNNVVLQVAMSPGFEDCYTMMTTTESIQQKKLSADCSPPPESGPNSTRYIEG